MCTINVEVEKVSAFHLYGKTSENFFFLRNEQHNFSINKMELDECVSVLSTFVWRKPVRIFRQIEEYKGRHIYIFII